MKQCFPVLVLIFFLEAIDQAKNAPFTIKEGVEYRMKVKFRVQHDVVSGLKYLQVVKRKGIRGTCVQPTK
jgi:Rho GDP-dissociation inhibitor